SPPAHPTPKSLPPVARLGLKIMESLPSNLFVGIVAEVPLAAKCVALRSRCQFVGMEPDGETEQFVVPRSGLDHNFRLFVLQGAFDPIKVDPFFDFPQQEARPLQAGERLSFPSSLSLFRLGQIERRRGRFIVSLDLP